VDVIDGEARLEELALMLGGVSESTRQMAFEILRSVG
jgi:hypothetical protein